MEEEWKLNLSNHGTKADLINAKGVDTSKFAKRFNFATNIALNAKINKVKSKIPSITN